MSHERCTGGINNAVSNCANQVENELHAYDDPQIDSETACVASPEVTTAFGYCDQQYRACFLDCGGTIER